MPDDIESSAPEAAPGINALAAFFGAGAIEEAHARGRAELEAAAEALRVAILTVDAKTLLGYLWGQLLVDRLGKHHAKDAGGENASASQSPDDTVMLALEYVHAVLSGYRENTGESKEEAALVAVLEAASRLQEVNLHYCLVAAGALPGVTDHEARTLAMHSMVGWTMLRAHRYQALEEEFFSFVLAPHEDALQQAYGIGAAEVARGLQAAVDAMRFGHMQAADKLRDEMEKTYAAAKAAGLSMKDAIKQVYATEEAKKGVQSAIEHLFFGGICDVGRSSGLPAALLDDLSYERGEETEFFAEGPLKGTPMRRLPARTRPLLRMEGTYYACDPNFLRDSAYRAIQWGLARRLAGYDRTWGERQAEVTESAFPRILGHQLRDATILSSVYYRDPDNGNWVENDLVVLINDAVLQIEVKAGVMPMHSPEVHFDRHVRTVQSLVVKAKQQNERFFRYAASAPEVPLYRLEAGQYVEVHRLTLSKYRLVLPIGLTVEAFTPFSSMSKRLPEMTPILGSYPFVSMSVDDLFVLTRLLPTTGELLHYLAVRQQVAGQPNAALVDELDHLGSYVRHNRMDMVNQEHFAKGVRLLTYPGASKVVDDYFSGPDWEKQPPPSQPFPALLAKFLQSNDAARGPKFLRADAAVRDFSSKGRGQLEAFIKEMLPTLKEHPYRWRVIASDVATLVWLQRSGYADVGGVVYVKAKEAALGLGLSSCEVLVIYVNAAGEFEGGWATEVTAPSESAPGYDDSMANGHKMLERAIPLRGSS